MDHRSSRIRLHRAPLVLASIVWLIGSIAFAQAAIPSPSALEGLDARAAVELANAWKGNGVTTFATPEAVHFGFPDGTEVRVGMPDDVMLVSIAPYFTHTHPCATHFMSGCQGELVHAPVHVQAILADGTVVIDELMPTMANGFIDLWLPRGQAVDLHLRLDGLVTAGRVTTFEDSRTCITTLQFTGDGASAGR